MTQVLADYGYAVNAHGGDREQQFSCDLHGSGRDMKPSARVYPASNSWYCFGCGRVRDIIQTVREKEGLEFWAALKVIESRYNLPVLPWVDDEELRPETLPERVQATLDSLKTFEEERRDVHRYLTLMTLEREVPMEKVLAYWEIYDQAVYQVAKGTWTEAQGQSVFKSLRPSKPS